MATRSKRAKRSDRVAVEASSGNVFADLGLPNAEEWLAKAELVHAIRTILRDRHWTERRAAAVLGIAESDLSDLTRGKLARFSQERLERFLNTLDMDVRIRVMPTKKGTRRAR